MWADGYVAGMLTALIVACPDCATPNAVQPHEGTAWVLCVNDFCVWRARVRLEGAHTCI